MYISAGGGGDGGTSQGVSGSLVFGGGMLLHDNSGSPAIFRDADCGDLCARRGPSPPRGCRHRLKLVREFKEFSAVAAPTAATDHSVNSDRHHRPCGWSNSPIAVHKRPAADKQGTQTIHPPANPLRKSGRRRRRSELVYLARIEHKGTANKQRKICRPTCFHLHVVSDPK
jgi:hypothetical protein